MAQPNTNELRLPDVRFVPVDSLVPHEQFDEQRLQPLVERFREQEVLRNPPVVAPLAPESPDDQRYVVLDGANRATAAKAAGLPHIVVQVVRYEEPGVHLSTWCHALVELRREEIECALERIPGLTRRAAQQIAARALLARREALACMAYADGDIATLHGGTDLRERNALLNAVVDTYRARGRFHRVTNDSIEEARARQPEVTALVVFPHFEPAEILELATTGGRLPAGISRHVIRWRALRLNVPIARLADRNEPLEVKNGWLKQWLHEKLKQRQVRFYEEPTVLFDE